MCVADDRRYGWGCRPSRPWARGGSCQGLWGPSVCAAAAGARGAGRVLVTAATGTPWKCLYQYYLVGCKQSVIWLHVSHRRYCLWMDDELQRGQSSVKLSWKEKKNFLNDIYLELEKKCIFLIFKVLWINITVERRCKAEGKGEASVIP